MNTICFPIIKYFNPEYSVNDASFSSFAGLRGAISLALAVVLGELKLSHCKSKSLSVDLLIN